MHIHTLGSSELMNPSPACHEADSPGHGGVGSWDVKPGWMQWLHDGSKALWGWGAPVRHQSQRGSIRAER